MSKASTGKHRSTNLKFDVMATTPGSVSQLLSQLNDNTKKYLEYFANQNLPEPSYDEGDGLDLQNAPPPSDIIASRDAAVEAADELHHLLLGPLGLLLGSPGDVGHPLLVEIRQAKNNGKN